MLSTLVPLERLRVRRQARKPLYFLHSLNWPQGRAPRGGAFLFSPAPALAAGEAAATPIGAARPFLIATDPEAPCAGDEAPSFGKIM